MGLSMMRSEIFLVATVSYNFIQPCSTDVPLLRQCPAHMANALDRKICRSDEDTIPLWPGLPRLSRRRGWPCPRTGGNVLGSVPINHW